MKINMFNPTSKSHEFLTVCYSNPIETIEFIGARSAESGKLRKNPQTGRKRYLGEISAALVLMAVILALPGCGGCGSSRSVTPTPSPLPGTTFTAEQIFSAPIGKQWDMVDDLGDVTHFAIGQAPGDDACEQGNHISMHITKTVARTYWGIGVAGAETQFNMSIDVDGSYRGISDPNKAVLGPESTVQWRPVDGLPTPYMIVPPSFTRGQSATVSTFYHGWLLRGSNTSECIAGASEDLGLIDWKSSFYESTIATPVYSGWAMVSEQWENCNNPKFAPGCGAHEKWYFAPGIGLVAIDTGTVIIRRI